MDLLEERDDFSGRGGCKALRFSGAGLGGGEGAGCRQSNKWRSISVQATKIPPITVIQRSWILTNSSTEEVVKPFASLERVWVVERELGVVKVISGEVYLYRAQRYHHLR